MTTDDFFRGLLAALRTNGVQFIDTRNDRHHESFQEVVEFLAKSADAVRFFRQTFVPSPFTGRYRDLDDALLRLQRGLLGASNPFYPGINLDISQERAARILNEFEPTSRELFDQLAKRFICADRTSTPSPAGRYEADSPTH